MFEDQDMQNLWHRSRQEDKLYQELTTLVANKERNLPTKLQKEKSYLHVPSAGMLVGSDGASSLMRPIAGTKEAYKPVMHSTNGIPLHSTHSPNGQQQRLGNAVPEEMWGYWLGIDVL
ncbi:hypothetical protein Ptr86124_014192 [Pyrenophora tritici-repentis]|nr:hypothetical protein Ptr86124_014192 [Pyrenophora tritici-repentis]